MTNTLLYFNYIFTNKILLLDIIVIFQINVEARESLESFKTDRFKVITYLRIREKGGGILLFIKIITKFKKWIISQYTLNQ